MFPGTVNLTGQPDSCQLHPRSPCNETKARVTVTCKSRARVTCYMVFYSLVRVQFISAAKTGGIKYLFGSDLLLDYIHRRQLISGVDKKVWQVFTIK